MLEDYHYYINSILHLNLNYFLSKSLSL